jgi:hypothetical protein
VRFEELDRQVTRIVDDLCRECSPDVSAEQVDEIVHAHYGRLMQEATINDFIPLLVHRHTKEQLLRISHGELSGQA